MRISLFFLLICHTIFAQDQYPKDYFRSPMDIPLQLAGNFGELRNNHFHAGFDFKTQQKEGFNIYAAAEGYVSRIKISTYGYGKAIYITHPNGYTTVYGHLKNASATIDKYIKEHQYKEMSFEIELFLKPNELVVKKGELVAYSGSTGGAEGPHLHFEIRDSKTERILNPELFGFDKVLPDTKKPVVSGLMVYPVDENATVNLSKTPIVLDVKSMEDGSYLAEKVLATGKIGFAINATDTDNVSYNKNGVYKVESFLNGNPSFGYQFDTFAFDESRYVNALIDYSRYKMTGQRMQKLFMRTPYGLSIIRTDNKSGILDIGPNVTQIYRIEVSDYLGNKSIITVPIEFSALRANSYPVLKTTPYFIKTDKDYNFEKGNATVFIPARTFYDDFFLDFDVIGDTLYLRNELTAVHTNFTVTLTDSISSEEDKKKMFIGSTSGKRFSYNSTTRKGNVFTTYTKNLGQFSLVKDTTAPKINMAKTIEGKWLSSWKALNFTISDSLSGIKEYNGWLNGKWILFEYDYKTRTITHYFDDTIVQEGRNELKIVVSDNVGNSTTFETHFFRSQK